MNYGMPLLVGTLLALGAGLLGRVSGLDRDRAFYTTMTIVVGSYYVLFAAMGAPQALLLESLVGGAFLAGAVLGFRSSLWIVVVALGGHGIFDLAHGYVISNPGVPSWWPAFCSTYDVIAAGFLAWLLTSGRIRATA